jgi:hypothetical protein
VVGFESYSAQLLNGQRGVDEGLRVAQLCEASRSGGDTHLALHIGVVYQRPKRFGGARCLPTLRPAQR